MDRCLRVLNARATELEQGFPFGVVQQLFERPLLEADSSERERWLAGAASLAQDVLTEVPGTASAEGAPAPQMAIPPTRCNTAWTWLASNFSR